MKRLYLFAILAIAIICISLFFIDFKVPPEKVNVASIEEEQQKTQEQNVATKDLEPTEKNEPLPEVKPVSAQKYVFKKYDHLANAQAFVVFLKKKNIGFEIVLEGEDAPGGVSIYFEFYEEQDKQDKLKALAEITGTDYTIGGGV